MTAVKKPAREPQASREARQLAVVILEVLAGSRTSQQAAQAIGLSLPRYYQLEARAVAGLIGACEARPRGRQGEASADVARANRGIGKTSEVEVDRALYERLDAQIKLSRERERQLP